MAGGYVASGNGLLCAARAPGSGDGEGAVGAFGLMLGTVGLSARGIARGTLGIDLLLDGVPIVPAIVGLFAAAELFNLVGGFIKQYISVKAAAVGVPGRVGARHASR